MMTTQWPETAQHLSSELRNLRGGAVDVMKAFSSLAQSSLAPGALDGGLAVEGDAIVATRRHRNRQRDQFLGLDVQRARRERALREGGKALHDVGGPAAQVAQFAAEVLGRVRPIGDVHRFLLVGV